MTMGLILRGLFIAAIGALAIWAFAIRDNPSSKAPAEACRDRGGVVERAQGTFRCLKDGRVVDTWSP